MATNIHRAAETCFDPNRQHFLKQAILLVRHDKHFVRALRRKERVNPPAELPVVEGPFYHDLTSFESIVGVILGSKISYRDRRSPRFVLCAKVRYAHMLAS